MLGICRSVRQIQAKNYFGSCRWKSWAALIGLSSCASRTLLRIIHKRISKVADIKMRMSQFRGCDRRDDISRLLVFSGIRSMRIWLGGLDSNQDSQLQRLMSYQLNDLPAAGGQQKRPLARPISTLLAKRNFVNCRLQRRLLAAFRLGCYIILCE